jgi:hypothetical protein
MKPFIAAAIALTALAGTASPTASQATPGLALRCNVDAPDIQFIVAPPCPEVPRYVPEKVNAHIFVAQLQPEHSYSFIWTNCRSATASCSQTVLLSQPTTVSVLVTDNTTAEQQSLSITIGYADLGAA